ncbi:MAG: hypothetical protein GX876_04280 [Bacteroidales bacterium]|jgi:hypothetical protein|nr:hypothetical protein [Bacteroidales bacterium]
MGNIEKSEHLKNKLKELINFRTNLTADNLDDFNTLTKEILDLLDDNQKLRFHQIKFYDEIQDPLTFGDGDLPF